MKRATLATLAIICIAAVIGIYYLTQRVPGVVKPTEVMLTGHVTTVGTGTSPTLITFTSMRDQKTYVASVSGGNPGTYSISLPNLDSYQVKITWKILGVTGGSANAGTLNIDTYSGSMQHDWSG